MIKARWQHSCTDGYQCDVTTETDRHPIAAPDLAPICAQCQARYRLVRYDGPKREPSPRRKPAYRKGGFRAEQLDLF